MFYSLKPAKSDCAVHKLTNMYSQQWNTYYFGTKKTFMKFGSVISLWKVFWKCDRICRIKNINTVIHVLIYTCALVCPHCCQGVSRLQLCFLFMNTSTYSCVSGLEKEGRQSVCREGRGSQITTQLEQLGFGKPVLRGRLPLGHSACPLSLSSWVSQGVKRGSVREV